MSMLTSPPPQMDYAHDPQDTASQQQQQHQFHHQNTGFSNVPNPNINYEQQPPQQSSADYRFDIIEWYPKYQSCQRYFIDHAQHSGSVQAVAAFLNIHLPYQRHPNPVLSTSQTRLSPGLARPSMPNAHVSNSTFAPSSPLASFQAGAWVSLIPYLRRLVVTGLDVPALLHGFFGDDWITGVGPIHEQERRNYLFAAKSGGWASVKKDYDMLPLETVPFLRPLQLPSNEEILAAEKSWSEWLAMEDWMVGPRAPVETMDPSTNIGKERSSSGGGGGGGGVNVTR
ncbi:MAG: hypothetical protein MMC33_000905 [Icmadophila ericetorum]|nr:hypothetical protein [Icmadophila ericetorum]